MKRLITIAFFIAAFAAPSFSQAQKPELVNYRRGTSDRLSKAIWSFRQADYDAAVKRANATLDHEPSAMEARWILALAHQSRGELGLLLEALKPIAIREAKESRYALDIVARGSKGYVLALADRNVKIDFGLADGAKVGDSYIVYAEGEALQHPITFQILYVEKRPVAEVEVRAVFNSHANAEVVKAYGRIEPGMRVQAKSEYQDIVELQAARP